MSWIQWLHRSMSTQSWVGEGVWVMMRRENERKWEREKEELPVLILRWLVVGMDGPGIVVVGTVGFGIVTDNLLVLVLWWFWLLFLILMWAVSGCCWSWCYDGLDCCFWYCDGWYCYSWHCLWVILFVFALWWPVWLVPILYWVVLLSGIAMVVVRRGGALIQYCHL